MMRAALIVLAAVGLSACGEKPQSMNSSYKPDQKAWEASNAAWNVKGYKAGDKALWEAQMRTRSQMQNEYTKAN